MESKNSYCLVTSVVAIITSQHNALLTCLWWYCSPPSPSTAPPLTTPHRAFPPTPPTPPTAWAFVWPEPP